MALLLPAPIFTIRNVLDLTQRHAFEKLESVVRKIAIVPRRLMAFGRKYAVAVTCLGAVIADSGLSCPFVSEVMAAFAVPNVFYRAAAAGCYWPLTVNDGRFRDTGWRLMWRHGRSCYWHSSARAATPVCSVNSAAFPRIA